MIVYKDFSSIAFVRCISPIRGSLFHAEGTGFSINKALEKCLSEKIEREFQIKKNLFPLGIAAHRVKSESSTNALHEAMEALMLQKIANENRFSGIRIFKNHNLRIYLCKINRAWFSLIASEHNETKTYSYAVRKSLICSLLQSWSEYRNIKIYNPSHKLLKRYTKANRLFTNPEYVFSLKPQTLDTSALVEHFEKTNEHFVTYFTQGENK